MFKSLIIPTVLIISTVFSVSASAQSLSKMSLLEKRLQKVERQATRISDLTLAIDALKRENRELRGEIETQTHTINQLKRKQRDLYLDVDQRLSEMQSGLPTSNVAASVPVSSQPISNDKVVAEKVVSETTKVEPVTYTTKVETSPDAIQAEYKAAYQLLSPQQRQYKEAVVALNEFVAKYPSNGLVSNAQYWLGEAYYVSQDNENALLAFRKLVADYPDSAKVPGALYKIARIQYAQEDVVGAKATLASLQKDYADSSAAGLAKQFLARIQRENK